MQSTQRCEKFLELSSRFRMVKLQLKEGFRSTANFLENLQEKTLVTSRFVYSSVKSDANHFSELSFSPTLK